MLNLFSLKDGKREADSGGNRPNQKRGTAAQIRITKGTSLSHRWICLKIYCQLIGEKRIPTYFQKGKLTIFPGIFV